MTVKIVQKHEQKSIVTSGVATLQVPTGGKLCSIALHFQTSAGASVTEAQIRAEIANIRMSYNGRDLVNATPDQLLDMYEALGTNVHNNTGVAGVVELNLGRLLFTDPKIRDLFGYGTGEGGSIQIQVTAGTLSAIALLETYTERLGVNEVLGTHTRFINYPQSFNSASAHTVDTLPRTLDSGYLALLVDDGASGTIANTEIRVGASVIREKVPLNVNKQILSNNRMEQPSGYYVTSFAEGAADSFLPMKQVTDFRVVTEFSVAAGAGGYKIGALTVERLPV